jgi:predicted O-methyltransferase YrrM
MPDFGRDSGEGQLCTVERIALNALVRQEAPETVFEVGTWRGGGSTYFISSALHENGHGMLYTCESNPEFYNHAVTLYQNQLSDLRPFVSFSFGKSNDIYPPILKKIGTIDMVMLDGAEDPNQTVREYFMFVLHFRPGSFLICHDWKTSKMEKLRDVLMDKEFWEVVTLMEDTSTGFSIFKRK